jgi:signal transduction histidine kinase
MKEEKEGYEFVSIAAHQLRGPIGSIRGYASMILDGDYGLIPDNLFEAVNLIFKAADSLNKTVNDFLDTSWRSLCKTRSRKSVEQ